MNNYCRSSPDPPDEDSLSGLLYEATQQIRNEPEAPEALERALVSARNLQRPFVLSRVKIKSQLLLVSSLAVMLLLGTFVASWFSPPANVWAQLLAAVQDKPWIHAHTVTSDGTKLDIWVSTSGDISARRYGETVEYEDYRKGVRYRYDPITQRISLTRIDHPPQHSKKKLQLVRDVFQGIFPEKSNLTTPKRENHLKQGSVGFYNRKQIEYVLNLDRGGRRARLVFGVDPVTRLPASMRLFTMDRQEPYVKFRFGFPQEGPKDVYALGVPRTAEIVGEKPNNQETHYEFEGA